MEKPKDDNCCCRPAEYAAKEGVVFQPVINLGNEAFHDRVPSISVMVILDMLDVL